MIQRIDIRNFMRLQNVSLEFSNGITTIIGDSDLGKTSIFRAIDAVSTNQFPAATYATHGSKSYEIRLKVDGVFIYLKKEDKAGTTYKTKYPDGKEELYEKVRHREVPLSVQQLLEGVKYIDIAGVRLRPAYQEQKEKEFLFTLPRTTRTELLSRLAGSFFLRKAQKEVATKSRKSSASLDLLNSQLAETKQKQAESEKVFEYIREHDLEKKLEKANEELTKLEVSQSQVERLSSQVPELKSLMPRAAFAKKNEALLQKAKTQLQELRQEELLSVKKSLEQFRLGSKSCIYLFKNFAPKVESAVTVLNEAGKYNKVSIDLFNVKSVMQQLKGYSVQIEQLKAKAAELIELEGTVVCPLCGTEVNKANIDQHLMEKITA